MKAEKELKTLKFIKRFQGKIRYINRETGLIGALFDPSQNTQCNQNKQNHHNFKQEIIDIISNPKKSQRYNANLQKIRQYTQQMENTAIQFRKQDVKSVDSKKRTLTLPKLNNNNQYKEGKQIKVRKNSFSHNSQYSERRGYEKIR